MERYDIFISYKKTDEGQLTLDAELAKNLYLFLKANGYAHVFFSDEEIAASGDSNYVNAINQALDQATVLIFVATQAKYLNTRFVKYEWESFSNEINSGRKPNGQIFGVVEGVRHGELPYALRGREVFEIGSVGDAMLLKHLSRVQGLSGNRVDPTWRDAVELHNASLFRTYGYLRDNYFEREDASQFFTFFAECDSPLAVVYAEDNCGSSAIAYNNAYRLTNEHDVAYMREIADVSTFLDHHPLESEDPLLFIVDKLKTRSDLDRLIDILAQAPLARIATTIPMALRPQADPMLSAFSPMVFDLRLPDEAETQKNIRMLSSAISLPLSGNLESILLMPSSKGLRNPFMLKLIFTSLKDMSEYSDSELNIADVFSVVEDFLSSKSPKLLEAIDRLFTLYLDKKVNQFGAGELKEYLDEAETLCELSLLIKNRLGYTVANKEYLIYRIALTMLMTNGTNPPLQAFDGMEDSIPYFIYLCYLNTQVLRLDLSDDLETDQIIKLLSFLLSEKDIFQDVVRSRRFDGALLKMVKEFRRSGLYLLSQSIIDAIETAKIPSTEAFDYLSEKMMVHYYLTGKLLEVNSDVGLIPYRRGYVRYCMDDFDSALKDFAVAYEQMKRRNAYELGFVFDYIEVLMDVGDNQRIRSLLQELRAHHSESDPNYQIAFYLYLGIVAVGQMDFAAAESQFLEALGLAYRHFNLRRIQRIDGELANLYLLKGDYANARKYALRNLDIAKSLEDLNGIAISSKTLGKIAMLERSWTESYKHLTIAELYAERANNHWRLSKIRLLLSWFEPIDDEVVASLRSQVDRIRPDAYVASTYPLLAISVARTGNVDSSLIEDALSTSKRSGNVVAYAQAKAAKALLARTSSEDPAAMASYLRDWREVARLAIDHALEPYGTLPLPLNRYQELHTEHLDLVALSVHHAQDIFAYASLATTTKYVLWDRHETINDTIQFIQSTRDHQSAGYGMSWAIVHREDRRVIGTIDLSHADHLDGVEVGYILNSFYWGYGYATEALREVVAFVESRLTLDKIYGVFMTENQKSKRTLEKAGFVFSHLIPNYHKKVSVVDHSGTVFVRRFER